MVAQFVNVSFLALSNDSSTKNVNCVLLKSSVRQQGKDKVQKMVLIQERPTIYRHTDTLLFSAYRALEMLGRNTLSRVAKRGYFTGNFQSLLVN